MIIDNLKEKIKSGAGSASRNDILLVGIMVVLAAGSFGLGRLSKSSTGGTGITLQTVSLTQEAAAQAALQSATDTKESTSISSSKSAPEAIFGSKNGTKYYWASCSGASRIKEENKVFWSSEEEARGAGYEKSSTCK